MLSASGLLGATITVAATTIDDAVWLVPYVVASGVQQSWTTAARIVHAMIFLATLEFLALVSVVVAKLIAKSATAASSPTSSMHTSKKDRDITDEDTTAKSVADADPELMLGIIAALLCWLLALFFYIKKMLKRKRRQQQAEERMGLATATANNPSTTMSYGTSATNTATSDNNDHIRVDDSLFLQQQAPHKALSCSSIATVMSLTTLGALDELSYFPALLVGKIFTPLEICLGTLLAAMTILTVVSCCLAKCQPLVDWLDQIPIYAVIAVFASILTLEILYDVVVT